MPVVWVWMLYWLLQQQTFSQRIVREHVHMGSSGMTVHHHPKEVRKIYVKYTEKPPIKVQPAPNRKERKERKEKQRKKIYVLLKKPAKRRFHHNVYLLVNPKSTRQIKVAFGHVQKDSRKVRVLKLSR
ncbi:uncharacterized protein LOC117899393 [Drosophila subobscura]|uniref:uncharacterized protein LOC117899393 n=1 Tax=Drosophila subobscura TaxID=7241 RepID=UPI00155B0C34|nr:uncharacterized protein LOC117899393 [Drosophila subobscura]